MALTFGNVKHPAYTKHIIWNQAWDDLGPRRNFGVVYHRMLGLLMGTEAYFEGGAAGLTHYGTGHPGDHDGELRMWCDPLTNRAPWASGRVIAPWGDGPAFVQKYGANAVNNDLIAIEISGGYDDPISDLTRDTVAALTAYWADQAKVPWDKYPLNPTTGLTYTYWHQEFTGPQEKICPGPVVMQATDDIIARTVAMLKAAQEQAVPTYPPPFTFPKSDGLDHDDFKALGRIVTVKRGGGAECRTRASKDSPFSHDPIPVDTKVPVIYIIKNQQDGSRWYCHKDGHRMPMTHFEETFSTNLWT
jgi:hypothetical protein